MPFDSRKEAQTLEHLAQNRIDTSDGLNANIALAGAWAGLTQSERNATGKTLSDQFDNAKWNGLPRPVINLDADGNCTSLDFKASALDFHKEAKHVKVSNDGDVAIWVSAD